MHSNFITPPDFVETVLILDATEEQIKSCAEAVKMSGKSYNVYFYNFDMNNHDWYKRVANIADLLVDARLVDPVTHFNK
jgi:hypothetical protein